MAASRNGGVRIRRGRPLAPRPRVEPQALSSREAHVRSTPPPPGPHGPAPSSPPSPAARTRHGAQGGASDHQPVGGRQSMDAAGGRRTVLVSTPSSTLSRTLYLSIRPLMVCKQIDN